MSRLKIVIQGYETCGIIADLATEMKAQGHDVVTIAEHSSRYDRTYDYRLIAILNDYLRAKRLPASVCSVFSSMLWRASPAAHHLISAKIREHLCASADLYVQVWSGWHGEYALLKRLREKGVKIATLFMGSEVRNYACFQQQYHEEDWAFPDKFKGRLDEQLRRIRTHELYTDAIFSVPDQMGLAVRPYHHLQVPIRCQDIEFNVPDRTRPLVMHAPTDPAVKGTHVIEAALKQLKSEGCEFDYLPIQGVPHQQLLKILSMADVLVDEVLLHGPGWLGFEAMAAGCCVATRYLVDSPPIFRPPVHPIDRRCIVQQLRVLLTDQSLRRELAYKGRSYVEKNNHVSGVVKHLIARTFDGKGAEDYHPSFFAHFRPQADNKVVTKRRKPSPEKLLPQLRKV